MPGIDRQTIEHLDFQKAIKRINRDTRSDFIFAPHINSIYTYAADELIDSLTSKISSGGFNFSLPIMISVPKASRCSRPGVIQYPHDRLVYQTIIDCIAGEIEENIDRTCVFSNIYMESGDEMFEDPNVSYRKFQNFLRESIEQFKCCLKTDIASYFESINHHIMINLLTALNIDKSIVGFLEKALTAWREQNSYGIIQGIYGSDVLGNYYLTHLDYFLKMNDFHYCRYLDDIYIP